MQGAAIERGLDRAILPRFHAGWSIGTVAGAGTKPVRDDGLGQEVTAAGERLAPGQANWIDIGVTRCGDHQLRAAPCLRSCTSIRMTMTHGLMTRSVSIAGRNPDDRSR